MIGRLLWIAFTQLRRDRAALALTFVLPLVPEGTVTVEVEEREPVTVVVPGGGTVSVEIP